MGERASRRAFSAAGALLTILSGCGGSTGNGATTANSVPAASFTLACTPSSFLGVRCGSGSCLLNSTGLWGDVQFSCAGTPAGVQCGFGPNPVFLPNGLTARTGFTVSADPAVAKGSAQVRIAAFLGGQQRTADVTFASPAVAPGPSGDTLTVYGCAGYAEGLPAAASLRAFSSTFVGAWANHNVGFNGFCREILADSDGWFVLEVPWRCVPEGGDVYLTSGGVATCTPVTFHRGGTVFAEVVGRGLGQTCP